MRDEAFDSGKEDCFRFENGQGEIEAEKGLDGYNRLMWVESKW